MNAPVVSTPTFNEACTRKTRYENRWTAAEDKILLAQVLKANGRSICWRSVAAALPGRNNKSCRKRWIHSLNPGLRKGRWTAPEDISLTAAVKVHGKHWFQVARMLGNGRTDDQCAKRWREALDPNIKRGPWGEHEDEKLIAMFRIHGRKWNDIAASLDGRPPVQCRNRWLSLVRAGKLEDDIVIKPELREDLLFHLPTPGPEAAYQSTFETATGSDSASGHFPLRRTSWGDYQTGASYDENLEQPQLYPPTYPEGQYHEQPTVPPIRTTDLVGPGYYPSSHNTGYSPSPHVPAEEVQPDSGPLQVFAPTPVNLVIQTNFTRVEHNYYYSSQESDTSSGYGSTPPNTASSTRSSFSFSSADSPTTPYDQTQEYTVGRTPQSHPTTHSLYLPYPLHHRYDAGGSFTEHGIAPCHSSSDERVHPHGACYVRGIRQYPGDCGSTERDCGYESEPESDEGWVTRPVPGYGFYATPNQAADMWRHTSWFHSGMAKNGGSDTGSGEATDTSTGSLGSVEHPTDYDVQSC